MLARGMTARGRVLREAVRKASRGKDPTNRVDVDSEPCSTSAAAGTGTRDKETD